MTKYVVATIELPSLCPR